MINKRKLDHIKISLENPVESELKSGFEDIHPVHRALPEANFSDIDLSTDFFGKKLALPLVISGMTGGHEKAKKINKNLAIAARETGVAMGIGSQRAAIENRELTDSYRIAREEAPDAFIIANLGAVQMASDYTTEHARQAVEMIEADALAIHLNPLHEAVQPEGDRDFRGCIKAISELNLKVPIIAKETGAGICREDAMLLENAGVSGIDIGGLGGTTFAAVESYREGVNTELARQFFDWGIPTATSTIEVLEYTELPVISSGGIRSGLDVAKSIALGSIAAGMALPFLKEAAKGSKNVIDLIRQTEEELRTAMFLLGAENIAGLRDSDLVILGRTREWLLARGIDAGKYSNRRMKR